MVVDAVGSFFGDLFSFVVEMSIRLLALLWQFFSGG
jgi:hypothetical protein